MYRPIYFFNMAECAPKNSGRFANRRNLTFTYIPWIARTERMEIKNRNQRSNSTEIQESYGEQYHVFNEETKNPNRYRSFTAVVRMSERTRGKNSRAPRKHSDRLSN